MNMVLPAGMNVNWVPGMTLDEMEKHCILAAFRFYRENKTQTSIALGISVRTLDTKLEKYTLEAQRHADFEAEDRIKRADLLDRMRGKQITEQYGVGHSINQDPFMARAPARAQAVVQNGSSAGTGIHAQPTTEIRSELPLPVSQRQEVQSVLSESDTKIHSGKRRKGI